MGWLKMGKKVEFVNSSRFRYVKNKKKTTESSDNPLDFDDYLDELTDEEYKNWVFEWLDLDFIGDIISNWSEEIKKEGQGKMKLFSQEALETTETIELSVQEVKDITKKPRKTRESKPKEERAVDLKYEISKERERLKELEEQDETGWNEQDRWYKGREGNLQLVKNHIIYYQQKLDALREPFNPLLNKWKEFIVNYCKEKEQEIEMIGFSESAPFDYEISVRIKGHYCYYSCISFRFDKGNLVAYDGLGGGTSFLGGFGKGIEPEQETESEIKELLDKVFNHECDEHHADFYNVDTTKPAEHRNIKIDEKGWIYYD
jgi:hypothetical protein